MDKTSAFDRFVHGGRIVAGFSMFGAVAAGMSLVWIPAFASVDVHAIGAVVGAVTGLVLNARHIV